MIGLEALLRQLVRDEVRAALAEVLGEDAETSVDDGELRQLAAARAATLKRARRSRDE